MLSTFDHMHVYTLDGLTTPPPIAEGVGVSTWDVGEMLAWQCTPRSLVVVSPLWTNSAKWILSSPLSAKWILSSPLTAKWILSSPFARLVRIHCIGYLTFACYIQYMLHVILQYMLLVHVTCTCTRYYQVVPGTRTILRVYTLYSILYSIPLVDCCRHHVLTIHLSQISAPYAKRILYD